MNCGARYLMVAGTLAVASATAVPGPAARAQSAMQFWVQQARERNSGYGDRRQSSRGWSQGPGYYGDNAENTYQPPQYTPPEHYEPPFRVSSPKYRNYVPDMPRRVKLDKVCQLEIASNDRTDPVPADTAFAAACAVTPTLTLRVLPQVGAALNDYYSKHPKFLWVHDGAVDDKARAAMDALALSSAYGLNPVDYHVALPSTANGNGDDPAFKPTNALMDGKTAHLKALMRFELTLSAKVLTYVLDATRGRVDPDRMSNYYDLPRKQVDLIAALGAITKTRDIVQYLDSRNPDNPQFRALVAALAKARAVAPQKTIAIPPGTFIRPGATDPALPQVIAAIKQTSSAAFDERHAKALAAYDGGNKYGQKLVVLVRDFQREMGLSPDGVIGPNTVQATQDTPADHIKKLELAMARMRWLPSYLGKRYVLLNQPAYQVTYVDGDRKPLNIRAIIGKPNHQTYFFTDTIDSIEFNPYWYVPRSIVINEMMPRLYNDPSYLDQIGFQVINANGQQVSSADVNWDAYARRQISVEVRQPPGPQNALGLLRINFPNRFAIYMHDTNERQLFKYRRLAFSHGCVRLKQPRVLAAALLNKPVSYVNEQIATGENFSQVVPGHIPVYLAYFTAWPNSNGVVHYYADVYGRDQRLTKALEKTEAARRAARKLLTWWRKRQESRHKKTAVLPSLRTYPNTRPSEIGAIPRASWSMRS